MNTKFKSVRIVSFLIAILLAVTPLMSCSGQKGEQGIQGEQGVPGKDGKSAYELAVDNGFKGTAIIQLKLARFSTTMQMFII